MAQVDLKKIVRKVILDDMLRPLAKKCSQSPEARSAKKNPTGSQHPRDPKQNIAWNVLIIENGAMSMINACCRMHDILDAGITLVEDLDKGREPLKYLEAIYLMTPSHASIDRLMADFPNAANRQYKAAYVFFTEACPDELINRLAKSYASKCVRTLKEINIAFTPDDSQVFSLNNPDTFQIYYNQTNQPELHSHLERIAEQIATLCATLGEYPSVRYRSDFDRNAELARLVQQKLDAYKAHDESMGQGPDKSRSQLLILDRGFDGISPLLHELSYQAMVYDLLPMENDMFTYETGTSTSGTKREKKVFLDENDALWIELRHQHIATVSKELPQKLQDFIDEKIYGVDPKTKALGHRGPAADKTGHRAASGANIAIKDLANLIKKLPHFEKELSNYNTHLSLAEKCMQHFRTDLDKLCKAEQDLAMGVDSTGEKLKDDIKLLSPLLVEPSVVANDKMRLIMLHVLTKNGIPEENLHRLLKHANIPMADKATLTNLSQLGVNVIAEQRAGRTWQPNRKDRVTEQTYQMSRWTPVIKDLMEECLDDKLDHRHFPYLGTAKKGNDKFRAVSSARHGKSQADTSQRFHQSGPRLIVFIVGGVSYSEMRCAYEVTKERRPWEVIIGSDQIITPRKFLDSLSKLAQPMNNHQEV